MKAEGEIIKELEKLKRELDLKECLYMSSSQQLANHIKIDALHWVLGYHPPWPELER